MNKIIAAIIALLTGWFGGEAEPTPLPRMIGEYAYEIFEVADPDNLVLKSNLTEKKSSGELKSECRFLVNGGFYDKNYRHLGLLKSEGKEISKQIKSELFNGLISAGDWSLQSGPVLSDDLQIRNDKPARRMVVGTQGKALVFMAVYKQGSVFEGPYLEELPGIIKQIGNFDQAINLDGGSASAWWDGKTHLAEANLIGSYFCVPKGERGDQKGFWQQQKLR